MIVIRLGAAGPRIKIRKAAAKCPTGSSGPFGERKATW